MYFVCFLFFLFHTCCCVSLSIQVDTNNDGSIDFDEFMKMMRGSQKKRYETSSSPFSRARALLYRKLE